MVLIYGGWTDSVLYSMLPQKVLHSASIWLPASQNAGWIALGSTGFSLHGHMLCNGVGGWGVGMGPEGALQPEWQLSGKQFILAHIWQVTDALKVVFAVLLPALKKMKNKRVKNHTTFFSSKVK